MTKEDGVADLLDRLLRKDPRAAAKLITIVENRKRETDKIVRGLKGHVGRAYVVGVTGPLGVGKSTLIDAMVMQYRKKRMTVSVIAVDPSSKRSGGALLGDRVRLKSNIGDKGVFFRSVATRGSLGGLAKCANNVVNILDAYGSDIIIVETVGAGQSDVDVQELVDTTTVILTPNLGDEIQLMKSGLVEIADIFVVNKGDLPGAEIMKGILESCSPKDHWTRPVVTTVANKGRGISEVIKAIESHRDYAGSGTRDRDREQRPTHSMHCR